jgi:iron complex outermembrane receptor protein
VSALTAPAGAALAASAEAGETGGTTIGELVITAEKREQNLQDVPVAVSAFTAAKRDLIGIQSIQDMTNFTPGLQYSTSTDRISLRGVGRLTNVLSADAAVANYNDGVYETFAVAAGRSSLFLERVEVLRGPQGTLYGRNAIGGAINEISRKPTKEPYAEARLRVENYSHWSAEVAFSGPLSDRVQFRLAGQWEKQNEGWIKEMTPGLPDEGNVIDEWFGEAQIAVQFSDRFEMWTKLAGAQWHNGAGGPGANSAAWTPMGGWPTYLNGNASVVVNPGYGCGPDALNVLYTGGMTRAQACANPSLADPWHKMTGIKYKVYLPAYTGVASHWTWHADDFDIKYITGGVSYHYQLTGSVPGGYSDPPVEQFTIPCATAAFVCNFLTTPITIHPQQAFDYQEHNGFWSHELNFISTTDGPLQWVAGGYLFNQHYTQPVFTHAEWEPHWVGPFPFGICAFPVCPPSTGARYFDNRPDVHARSAAIFGQGSYAVSDTLTITAGLRYSWDRKWGTESVRLTCFASLVCGVNLAQLGNFLNGPAIDLTGIPTVVAGGTGAPGDRLPRGVTGPTTYDPATGLATRGYDSNWSAVTGSFDVEWKPDDDTLLYGKYARGYKSGGFNIGIFTVLSFFPWTDKESVDSFEIGFKRSFGGSFQVNTAAFYYHYKNLQSPITIASTDGGQTQAQTAFLNVPKSVSRGFEAELLWNPIEDLNILLNYSYLDAYIEEGQAVDSSDPAALQPEAQPLVTAAACAATPGTCPADVFTVGLANGGFQRIQNLKGNVLPNAPKHKVAFNINYTFRFDPGTFNVSASYVWRDVQYGTLFPRWYTRAPAWDQVDLRATWKAANGKYVIIGFVKNVFDDLGYDNGSFATRLAGQVPNPVTGVPINFIQGVNGPAGYGAVPGVREGLAVSYSVTPPRTYGVEFQYKFF